MRAIGIILAGGNSYRMKELSQKRAIAAMPIGGSYRSIDFALSNMTNSKITRVGVLTQFNARSLNEHLSLLSGGTSDVSRADFMYLTLLLLTTMASGTEEQPILSTRTSDSLRKRTSHM